MTSRIRPIRGQHCEQLTNQRPIFWVIDQSEATEQWSQVMSHLAGNSSTEDSEQDKKNGVSWMNIPKYNMIKTLEVNPEPSSIWVRLSDSETEMNVWYFQQDKTIKCLSGHNYLTLPTLPHASLSQLSFFKFFLSWLGRVSLASSGAQGITMSVCLFGLSKALKHWGLSQVCPRSLTLLRRTDKA